MCSVLQCLQAAFHLSALLHSDQALVQYYILLLMQLLFPIVHKVTFKHFIQFTISHSNISYSSQYHIQAFHSVHNIIFKHFIQFIISHSSISYSSQYHIQAFHTVHNIIFKHFIQFSRCPFKALYTVHYVIFKHFILFTMLHLRSCFSS